MNVDGCPRSCVLYTSRIKRCRLGNDNIQQYRIHMLSPCPDTVDSMSAIKQSLSIIHVWSPYWYLQLSRILVATTTYQASVLSRSIVKGHCGQLQFSVPQIEYPLGGSSQKCSHMYFLLQVFWVILLFVKLYNCLI